MALMILDDKLTKALENGECVLGVFLDFFKAFDTVDHNILISKLYHLGIRGVALEWFQSYLSCRKQFATYNGVQSRTKTIKCGVPQGSILGPILFLLYIYMTLQIYVNLHHRFYCNHVWGCAYESNLHSLVLL